MAGDAGEEGFGVLVGIALAFAGENDAIGESDPSGEVRGLGAVGEVEEDGRGCSTK